MRLWLQLCCVVFKAHDDNCQQCQQRLFQHFWEFMSTPQAQFETVMPLQLGDCLGRLVTNPNFHVNCNSGLITNKPLRVPHDSTMATWEWAKLLQHVGRCFWSQVTWIRKRSKQLDIFTWIFTHWINGIRCAATNKLVVKVKGGRTLWES